MGGQSRVGDSAAGGATFDSLLRSVAGKCMLEYSIDRNVSPNRQQVSMSIDLTRPILIVDDYKTMLRIVANLLKQLGFSDIDEATDGSMALQKIKERKYNLVISDWNMEPMTGLQLLKEIRSDPKTKDLPFIMVTAESKTENVIAAKQAGVSNYIVKPFNAETLKGKITSVLGEF
jgi:two-component system chemotaxis response regulator CheY